MQVKVSSALGVITSSQQQPNDNSKQGVAFSERRDNDDGDLNHLAGQRADLSKGRLYSGLLSLNSDGNETMKQVITPSQSNRPLLLVNNDKSTTKTPNQEMDKDPPTNQQSRSNQDESAHGRNLQKSGQHQLPYDQVNNPSNMHKKNVFGSHASSQSINQMGYLQSNQLTTEQGQLSARGDPQSPMDAKLQPAKLTKTHADSNFVGFELQKFEQNEQNNGINSGMLTPEREKLLNYQQKSVIFASNQRRMTEPFDKFSMGVLNSKRQKTGAISPIDTNKTTQKEHTQMLNAGNFSLKDQRNTTNLGNKIGIEYIKESGEQQIQKNLIRQSVPISGNRVKEQENSEMKIIEEKVGTSNENGNLIVNTEGTDEQLLKQSNEQTKQQLNFGNFSWQQTAKVSIDNDVTNLQQQPAVGQNVSNIRIITSTQKDKNLVIQTDHSQNRANDFKEDQKNGVMTQSSGQNYPFRLETHETSYVKNSFRENPSQDPESSPVANPRKTQKIFKINEYNLKNSGATGINARILPQSQINSLAKPTNLNLNHSQQSVQQINEEDQLGNIGLIKQFLVGDLYKTTDKAFDFLSKDYDQNLAKSGNWRQSFATEKPQFNMNKTSNVAQIQNYSKNLRASQTNYQHFSRRRQNQATNQRRPKSKVEMMEIERKNQIMQLYKNAYTKEHNASLNGSLVRKKVSQTNTLPYKFDTTQQNSTQNVTQINKAGDTYRILKNRSQIRAKREDVQSQQNGQYKFNHRFLLQQQKDDINLSQFTSISQQNQRHNNEGISQAESPFLSQSQMTINEAGLQKIGNKADYSEQVSLHNNSNKQNLGFIVKNQAALAATKPMTAGMVNRAQRVNVWAQNFNQKDKNMNSLLQSAYLNESKNRQRQKSCQELQQQGNRQQIGSLQNSANSISPQNVIQQTNKDDNLQQEKIQKEKNHVQQQIKILVRGGKNTNYLQRTQIDPEMQSTFDKVLLQRQDFEANRIVQAEKFDEKMQDYTFQAMKEEDHLSGSFENVKRLGQISKQDSANQNCLSDQNYAHFETFQKIGNRRISQPVIASEDSRSAKSGGGEQNLVLQGCAIKRLSQDDSLDFVQKITNQETRSFRSRQIQIPHASPSKQDSCQQSQNVEPDSSSLQLLSMQKSSRHGQRKLIKVGKQANNEDLGKVFGNQGNETVKNTSFSMSPKKQSSQNWTKPDNELQDTDDENKATTLMNETLKGPVWKRSEESPQNSQKKQRQKQSPKSIVKQHFEESMPYQNLNDFRIRNIKSVLDRSSKHELDLVSSNKQRQNNQDSVVNESQPYLNKVESKVNHQQWGKGKKSQEMNMRSISPLEIFEKTSQQAKNANQVQKGSQSISNYEDRSIVVPNQGKQNFSQIRVHVAKEKSNSSISQYRGIDQNQKGSHKNSFYNPISKAAQATKRTSSLGFRLQRAKQQLIGKALSRQENYQPQNIDAAYDFANQKSTQSLLQSKNIVFSDGQFQNNARRASHQIKQPPLENFQKVAKNGLDFRPEGQKVTLNVRNTVMLTKMQLLERQKQQKVLEYELNERDMADSGSKIAMCKSGSHVQNPQYKVRNLLQNEFRSRQNLQNSGFSSPNPHQRIKIQNQAQKRGTNQFNGTAHLDTQKGSQMIFSRQTSQGRPDEAPDDRSSTNGNENYKNQPNDQQSLHDVLVFMTKDSTQTNINNYELMVNKLAPNAQRPSSIQVPETANLASHESYSPSPHLPQSPPQLS